MGRIMFFLSEINHCFNIFFNQTGIILKVIIRNVP